MKSDTAPIKADRAARYRVPTQDPVTSLIKLGKLSTTLFRYYSVHLSAYILKFCPADRNVFEDLVIL